MLPNVEVSQSPEEKFREYLASRPRTQRYTGQQRDMVRFIFSKHNHFDADSLIDEMKQAGFAVSRATIYRTLNKLVDAGLLRQLDFGPPCSTSTTTATQLHDHMFCTNCHRVYEFQHPAMAAMMDEVCRNENFRPDSHTFIIRGVCAGATGRRR